MLQYWPRCEGRERNTNGDPAAQVNFDAGSLLEALVKISALIKDDSDRL